MKSIYAGGIVLILALLVFRLITYSNHIKTYQTGQRITFTTTLREDPVVNTKTQSFQVNGPEGMISVLTDGQTSLQYGDLLQISGIVEIQVTKGGRR